MHAKTDTALANLTTVRSPRLGIGAFLLDKWEVRDEIAHMLVCYSPLFYCRRIVATYKTLRQIREL